MRALSPTSVSAASIGWEDEAWKFDVTCPAPGGREEHNDLPAGTRALAPATTATDITGVAGQEGRSEG